MRLRRFPAARAPAFAEGPAERGRAADRKHARELLAVRGCPVCAFVREREEKFFFWFALESYQDAGIIEKLDAALGFCPEHCRTLVAQGTYPGVLTDVYSHVVRAARSRLDARGPAGGTCIGCEQNRWAANHAIRLLLRSFADKDVEDRYRESPGLCADHFLRAVIQRKAGRRRFPLLEQALRLSLEGAGGVPVLGRFTGLDPDARLRAAFLDALPADPLESDAGRRIPARERLEITLGQRSCPACLTAGWAIARHLSWMAQERSANPDALSREVVGLCQAHLATCAVLEEGTAKWISDVKADAWTGVLLRLGKEEREARRKATTVSRLLEGFVRWDPRGRAAPRTVVPAEQALRNLAYRFPPCPTCRAARTAADRTMSLLLAALEEPGTERVYVRSHGVCVRHAGPRPSSLLRQTLCARLSLLEWELREVARKEDWNVRYELHGDEFSAWGRAMGQIDGRAFMGGEPRPR